MKGKKKIIIILMCIVAIILLSYIIWQKARDYFSSIATIGKIEEDVIMVYWHDTDRGYCYVSLKNVPIVDKKGNKISISNLKVGDVILVITEPNTVVFASDPPVLSDVKKIKIVK